MKIVVASDSFKGSLDAIKISRIAEKVAREVLGECVVTKVPMADGGEGTVDCLIEAMNGEKIKCDVSDPLLRSITAEYGRFDDTAIIEMASASGITLVADSERDILRHSTYGTGEMLLHALESGCSRVFMGIGGSATNDGGIGFAAAIGVRFLDEHGTELEPVPASFENIAKVDASAINPLVKNAEIVVMSDVNNPLLGELGATNIFGKQKGADENMRKVLERGMTHYIDIAENALGKTVRDQAGAGAAGGLGAALKLYANAEICSGVDTILGILNFSEQIKDADIVITGEGMMDHQSAYGKVASGVGKICKEQNVPCFAVVGAMGERAEEMAEFGIASIMPTVNAIMSLEHAIGNAEELYESAVRRALVLVKLGLEMGKKI